MPNKPKVLVTGSSGLIGGVLIRACSDAYEFSGLDMAKPDSAPDIPTLVTDVAELDAILPAFEGVDAVVHLAADPNMHGEWDTVLHNNFITTYNVFEAAKRAGVKRVVYASSNHAVGMWELEGPSGRIREGDYSGLEPGGFKMIDNTVQIRPDGYYGIGKAFGEATGAYYSDNFGLEVACLRIGTVSRDDDPKANVRMKATWLSHRDAAHLIERCLAVEGLKFEIFYGVSDNTWRFWDIEHAKNYLGYSPQDNAQDHWPEG
ncbi:MAG: NAD(P)-dependent oxidoreductase [Chloroflexi bacterium]|nr:NAD(P)-dependent oxidoreductase [Chloroflexota bacterium]